MTLCSAACFAIDTIHSRSYEYPGIAVLSVPFRSVSFRFSPITYISSFHSRREGKRKTRRKSASNTRRKTILEQLPAHERLKTAGLQHHPFIRCIPYTTVSMSDENEYYAYSSDEDNDVFMSQHTDDEEEDEDDTSLDPDEKEAMALENPNAAPVQSSFMGTFGLQLLLLLTLLSMKKGIK